MRTEAEDGRPGWELIDRQGGRDDRRQADRDDRVPRARRERLSWATPADDQPIAGGGGNANILERREGW